MCISQSVKHRNTNQLNFKIITFTLTRRDVSKLHYYTGYFTTYVTQMNVVKFKWDYQHRYLSLQRAKNILPSFSLFLFHNCVYLFMKHVIYRGAGVACYILWEFFNWSLALSLTRTLESNYTREIRVTSLDWKKILIPSRFLPSCNFTR